MLANPLSSSISWFHVCSGVRYCANRTQACSLKPDKLVCDDVLYLSIPGKIANLNGPRVVRGPRSRTFRNDFASYRN